MRTRGLIVIAALCLASGARAAPSARGGTAPEPTSCDPDTMSDSAIERCVARAEHSARRAFVAARGQCRTHGPDLTEMVGRVFDPLAFGGGVIAGWKQLTDDQRRDFAALADQLVGGQERARAISLVCTKGARIEDVAMHGSRTVFITQRRLDDEDCTSLMFERDDAARWRYVGEWYCGKDIFIEEWRHRLGGGDYDQAMAYLRGAIAAPAAAPAP